MLNFKGEYLGFTFNGHHSSEYGLVVVSDGDRYHQTLSSNFSDTVVSVPGKNGGYYFGTQLQMKDFTIRCAYDEMTSHMMHKIQNWLYPNRVGWLIFDETPYKKYKVKISNVPEFSFIPFDEFKNVKDYTLKKEILKGELQIQFFSFDEYGYENEDYNLPEINTNQIIKQQDVDSGLVPPNYSHDGICLPHQQLQEISNETSFNFMIYNAYFTIEKSQISDNNPLEFFNYNDGESYIINNPANIITKRGITLNSVSYYRIKLLGSKKEVWLDCLNSNKEKINEVSINIGACHNHYFPKIYHTKPTEIMIMSQNIVEGRAEPLFYTYSYANKDMGSSDSNEQQSYNFEELQKYWSDYIILTKQKTISINSILNPVFSFIHNEEGSGNYNITNELVYLIFPDKFYCDKTITDFVVEYKHTYI